MSKYYIYTSNTKEEAADKAQINLDRVNTNFQTLGGGIFCESIEELTANPEIEGNIYYYGFEEPPECARSGIEFDKCEEYQQSWKLTIEE